ncbi:DUF2147 domain-containing protein [Dyadobacter sp. CY323]|uniref:DUF2147 domain-containing protein n=1 Tax=Dyadobacter sp. CY323 TaxID=2907302 RepID=UPI001F254737|nr:DUF2147 domain-containing protein [Dyadobacter sp. CY323]MCE6993169.1 DUF2147 domain-containing protein [Dyadobacter sp. CY323]
MYQIIILLLFTLFSNAANAQTQSADEILGEWLSEEKDSRIEIYKVGSEYFGKLLWSENLFESDGVTSRKDVQNTNEKLRTRNLHNVNILHDFVYEDGLWDNGKMYDPKSGKTYNCLLKIRKKLLEVRSYIGIPLLGRSTYWERPAKNSAQQ